MNHMKPTPHDAAPLHVTGAARYIDDIPMPKNALSLAFGLSDVAHGKITAMDLDAVRSADGVVAVITADDLPASNDVSPSVHDEPMLANGTVHYIGQPIFLVIADTHLNARKAARMGKVEIQPLPAILTIDQAIAADSKFEDPIRFLKGEPDSAMKSAPHQISGSIEIGGQEHFYLEGQAASALPQENGDMLVHSSTQHPTEVQHKVAESLGLPFNAVRVETRRMGGGFGGKESQANALACACAVAARITNRPCKMRYDRDDDMMITGKRHDFRINYQVGFDDDGTLQSVMMEHFVRCGWAQDLSLPVADRAMLHSDNAYHLPHAKIISHRLKTNTQSATAYRGFGGPQGVVAIERVIDEVAHYLGRDPLEIRRANFYENGQTTPYHMTIEDSVIAPLVDQLAKASDYANRRLAIESENRANPDAILKRGIALTPVKFGISFTLTHLNQAGALVHIYADGSVHLNHGGTEMGQGLFTKVAQVAAHEFGLPLDMIKITASDTAKVPNTSATAASSGSDLNGMAVRDACHTLKGRIAAFFAIHFETDAAVEFVDGMVRAGSHEMTFADAASLAYQNRISLSATGFYATPKIKWDRMAGRGRPFFYFAYGAAVTEVVVDTLTGENRILRTDILHDVGASLNPAIDIGQIEGGYVQGAGWLTTEELVWDDKGNLRTHAPSTYKIPACSDRPRVFNVELFDNENAEDTIYRSKAVGEPPFMLGISAFHALSHAVGYAGASDIYPNLNAPATPEELLRAVYRNADGTDAF
ncbi:xanthine dehydrogenase molybdopterin binding subunit [Amylibacter kogurei]|uniref:Xanthine dehydrogenase molybdopterin binding subunit n=1 Tax=Paramylibacter kogurei TaxID=1889778 RepID=A0A2G5K594_9RHOB|nr:xanthine dehydrogenase molybdopterin binding subunit [Amylibacter kogurei]PIB24707.1 xanthine dehydrogenase molybdopterin binding subunit [Amylibacter kogurei]